MTKKDFELIARAIQRSATTTPRDREVRDRIISNLAYDLASTNPQFDHKRFVEACK